MPPRLRTAGGTAAAGTIAEFPPSTRAGHPPQRNSNVGRLLPTEDDEPIEVLVTGPADDAASKESVPTMVKPKAAPSTGAATVRWSGEPSPAKADVPVRVTRSVGADTPRSDETPYTLGSAPIAEFDGVGARRALASAGLRHGAGLRVDLELEPRSEDLTPAVAVQVPLTAVRLSDSSHAADASSQKSRQSSVSNEPSIVVEEGLSAELQRSRPGSVSAAAWSPAVARVAQRAPAMWAQLETVMVPAPTTQPGPLSWWARLWSNRAFSNAVLTIAGMMVVGVLLLADRTLKRPQAHIGRHEGATETNRSAAPEGSTSTEPQPENPAPTGSLGKVVRLVSEPPGAIVLHEGVVIGNTPLALPDAAPGRLYVLRKPGYVPEVVELAASTTERITVTMQAVANAAR